MDTQKNNFSGNNFNSDSELDLLFKKALKNHSVPTEDHVWRRINHGLTDKKAAVVTKSITRRSSLPIWSAVSGVAASLLIWALFFTPSTQNSLDKNSTTLANSDKTEVATGLNNTENIASSKIQNNQNIEENQNTEATSSKAFASNQQQIPPTITKNNTVLENQSVKGVKNGNAQNHIDEAVASLEKDQTKNKNRISQDKASTRTFTNPSTQISENVWTSDFVVHSSNSSLKKENPNADVHTLNLDNQSVAITIKVGKNENYNAGQTGFDANQNPSQFDKAKNVLKEVWNLKTGKKVNLQNILPNNENENNNEKTNNQSNSTNEIQAD